MRESFGNGASDPLQDLIEFNKEMQWTLIQLKKENDLMKENLNILKS